MNSFGRDLKFTLRTLSRRPGFSFIAVITLALGIGSSVAIFSTVYGVLLRPLPYEHPEQLTVLWAQWLKLNTPRVSHTGGDFREYQRQLRSFSGLAAFGSIRQNITGGEEPAQVQVGWISRNFFDVLGVKPAFGRSFAPGEPSSSLILGDALWHRYFGADRSVIGRKVDLDGRPYTIVGVLQPGFRLHMSADVGMSTDVDLWRPPDEALHPEWWVIPELSGTNLRILGRLKPGVTTAQAQAELDSFSAQLRARYPDHATAGFHIIVQPLHKEVVGHIETALLVLQGSVALVLFIACVNVANLLLVRVQGRQREIALRLALGGGAFSVTRQILLESLVLSVLGGIGGVVLASWEIQLLLALKPAYFPRLDSVALNGPVLLFALGITLLATLLSGLAPAASISKWNIGTVLKEQSSSARGSGTRMSRILIVAEVALSLVLLLGAGLLLRSFSRLLEVRPGFEPKNLLTFSISLPGVRYQAPDGVDNFLERLEGRIAQLPGVVSASGAWPLPLDGQIWYATYRLPDRAKSGENLIADFRIIRPSFLKTMKTRLVEGRTFRDTERNAILIDRNVAEHNWPGQSPLGKTIYGEPLDKEVPLTIVGVVEPILYKDLRTEGRETIYLPSRGWAWIDTELYLVVRTARDPRSLITPIRRELQSLDPLLSMAKPKPMESYVHDAQASNRFALIMMAAFSLVAVLLAAVGLYGVVSYALSRRTREIGIRMALGAQRSRLLFGATRDGMLPTLLGIAVGIAGSFLLKSVFASLLFGVEPHDLLTYLGMTSLLVLVALGASLIPARRAIRLNPTLAIRQE
jgi:putative ABC transport system permease protein